MREHNTAVSEPCVFAAFAALASFPRPLSGRPPKIILSLVIVTTDQTTSVVPLSASVKVVFREAEILRVGRRRLLGRGGRMCSRRLQRTKTTLERLIKADFPQST